MATFAITAIVIIVVLSSPEITAWSYRRFRKEPSAAPAKPWPDARVWIPVPKTEYQKIKFWANWNVNANDILTIRKAEKLTTPTGNIYFVKLRSNEGSATYRCRSVFYVDKTVKDEKPKSHAATYCDPIPIAINS